jgi:hypothetical protein
MKNKGILLAGIGLFITMSILLIYANDSAIWQIDKYELKKSKDLIWGDVDQQPVETDTTPLAQTFVDTVVEQLPNYDTANKKILLFGDSQAEGIMDPLYNYTLSSGHKFLFALPWYSASDMKYASNDTLKNIIAEFKPDYIIIVIGLNQVFQSTLDPSRKAVQTILKTIGDIPFSWIGPANWVEDKGINKVYEEELPKGSFFLSKNLTLPRGPDGRHPDGQGYKIWMDSIATWLHTKAKWKINMVKPTKMVYKRGFKLRTLNAGRRANKNVNQEVDSTKLEITSDSTAY